MELTPENKDIPLSPTDIDAQFKEKGMLAHFQNTCKPHSVNTPEEERYKPTQKVRKKGNWEYVEFRDDRGETQCKYKVRDTVLGEEEIGENVHIVWYRDEDGKKYVAVTVDPDLLED